MIMLITGSRGWTDETIIYKTLDTFYLAGYDTLMHGAAQGVDTVAARWAGYRQDNDWDVKVKEYAVLREHWNKYGNSAGIRRNIAMVDKIPDIVLGFIRNDSPGASHCVRYAEQKGIRTIVFRQDYPDV